MGLEDTLRLRDGVSSVTIDTRYWPIAIASWIGKPTEDLVRQYFAQADTRLIARARKGRLGFILITDATTADQPSPKARTLIADLTNAQPEDAMALSIGSFLVVDNAIIRGVVTALRWVLPRMRDVESVQTMEQALTRSLALLDGRKIPRPADCDARAYRRPA